MSPSFEYVKDQSEGNISRIFGDYLDPGNSYGDNIYVRIIEK